jgi:tetratricopeptide (TPR) repeat protein
MKFKSLYFYGAILFTAVIVLILVTQQDDKQENIKNDEVNTQEMPQDDVHSQFRSESNDSPNKENLSEEYYQKLAEFKNTVEQNPGDTLAMRNYADYLAASHKNDEAAANYSKILEIDPSRIDILFNLSFLYYNLGNMDKADEYNNRVLKLELDHVSALYNKGAISATRGDTETAREIWNRIVKDFPKSETTVLAKQSLERL